MENKISSGFQAIHDLIKPRWIPEILKSIHLGNRRYSDILSSIPYMSHTELNRKLSMLIEKGVITKADEENITRYSLCGFGKDLVHIFYHLEDLEDKYIKRWRG